MGVQDKVTSGFQELMKGVERNLEVENRVPPPPALPQPPVLPRHSRATRAQMQCKATAAPDIDQP